MQTVLDWFRANNDVFGFGVAALIFLITIILVSRKMIGFWITLLLLFFALFSGLIIGNQSFFKEWMMKDSTPQAVNSEIETDSADLNVTQEPEFDEYETLISEVFEGLEPEV